MSPWANLMSRAEAIGLALPAVLAALTAGIQPVVADTAEPPLAQPQRTRLVSADLPAIDFSLTDQDGRPARFSDFRGSALLVFFGFTNCPGVCPAAMQKLRQVRRSLAADPSPPRVVLISVDGARDTPSVMKEFLAPMGEGFVGLTGAPSEVRPIADRFSAVFFKGGPTDAAGGYEVEHTAQSYLVDREGRLRATFYNAPAEDMVAVTTQVMRE